MKNSSDNKLATAKKILICVVAVLTAAVLIIAAFSHNTVKTSRTAGDYTVVENVVS